MSPVFQRWQCDTDHWRLSWTKPGSFTSTFPYVFELRYLSQGQLVLRPHHHHHHHRLYNPGWALASSWGFITVFFSRGGVVSLTPNPQPGGPGYPFLSGSSPLICLAWEALPVAFATTSIALGIIWPHKPHPYAKVAITSGGCFGLMISIIMILLC
jgi:hypothetical protein